MLPQRGIGSSPHLGHEAGPVGGAAAGGDLGHGAAGIELPQGLITEVARARTLHRRSLTAVACYPQVSLKEPPGLHRRLGSVARVFPNSLTAEQAMRIGVALLTSGFRCGALRKWDGRTEERDPRVCRKR
jgi:hypothetical protein